ncbi:MAG: hypothetical protein HYZ53_01635 [Planctomycetes bacterium]|nr:hypothetical protein [Planctomycetota bacterium]
MSRRTLSALALALGLGLSLVLSGCGPSGAGDPKRVGREGWVMAELKPFEMIHADRSWNEATYVVNQTAQEFLVIVKPSGRATPIFPNSQLLRSKDWVYKEERWYSIPAGKSFNDVYEWYLSWFNFGGQN